jgi:N12 class adenine-specific DNA methylase
MDYDPISLVDAFKKWLRNYPNEDIKKVTSGDIINSYLEQGRKPQIVDKKEWEAIKSYSRGEGERLFKIFLHEALLHEDQVKIDRVYNEKHNAIATLNYRKIPIGVEISRKFGDNDLDLREAQREGIAFMELVGSGVVAYDVGVGKTMTAIAEMCTAIKNGKAKRPLVVVPNPTYENWVNEMFGKDGKPGILSGTGITLNKWYNLGAGFENVDFTKPVKEGSITLVTYEGLQKIGFNEKTQDKHFSFLKSVVTQENETTKERETEKNNEKIEEVIGVGLKGTIADIDDLGIDYMCVDEAHNFKNVFSEVKSDENGKQFYLKGGLPSNRGIKMFFLANYIQREYGRNVMLLTATPFTNSPLEIYSMLSLVAYKYMKENSISNLKSFFEQFIHETYEWVVSTSGSIQQKTVVKSFNNRIALQKLINSHINFKTGEEANIKRPCKINIPKTTKGYLPKSKCFLTLN